MVDGSAMMFGWLGKVLGKVWQEVDGGMTTLVVARNTSQ